MNKIKKLRLILSRLKRVVIAYSGGLDSTFLLKVALDSLGKNSVLAVTARSETYPYSEYKEAKRIAKSLGVQHLTIHTRELNIKGFKSNPINRCYYCKDELFRRLKGLAEKHGLNHVIDGANADDLKDVRYGMQAAKELGVRSPLLEAGIGKDFVRRYSRLLGLETWNKPSFACLASRFPYHTNITRKDLEKIDRAESCLRQLGFKQVRVRLHKDIARLEFYKEDFGKILDKITRERALRRLKDLGFKYITLDLEGYRTGSMNEPYLLTNSKQDNKIHLLGRKTALPKAGR